VSPQEALIEQLKRQIASLRQGIEMMEKGILATGEPTGGWIIDSTRETIAFYRLTAAELERTLESIEGKAVRATRDPPPMRSG
jgi:hypothetical protein